MRNAKKIAGRWKVFGWLACVALLFEGCSTWTPASSYNTKKDLLGQSPHPTAESSQTNSPASAAPKPQPAP